MKMLRKFENRTSMQLRSEIDDLENQRKKLKQGVGIDALSKDYTDETMMTHKQNYSFFDNGGFPNTQLKPRKLRVSKSNVQSMEIFQNYKNQLIDREIKKSNNLLSALENKYNCSKQSGGFSKITGY